VLSGVAPVARGRRLADDGMGVLAGLGAATQLELERRVHEVRLSAGTQVFDLGDVGHALYVVRAGLVDITAGRGNDRHLETIGPGEVFGEQALLTGRPRTAKAVTQTGATLWRLDYVDFLFLVGMDPQLGARIATALSDRLSSSIRNPVDGGSARGQTVVLRVGPAPAAAEFCAEFARACAPLLRESPIVLACGPPEVWQATQLSSGAEVCHPEDLAGAAVRAVRTNALVILLCATDPPADVLASAHRVVVIGDPLVDVVRERGRAVRTLPSVPQNADVDALAREVCGCRIGLALGSGGVRGWAHAGVLGVLAEEQIPIDFVSGASAGALAGALFVGGVPPDEMLHVPTIARDVLSACVRSYRPSPRAMLSNRPIMRYLRDRLGDDARIEDLPKPFVVATTDLDTREAVHLSSGPLAEAIAASAAVNGIFPPVVVGDQRLVDGGASDPVPVGVLRSMGADIVIAVNVMEVGRGAAGVYTPRFRIPLPGIIDNLMIGLDTVMSQVAVQSCRTADVIVAPRDAGATWRDVLPASKYAAAGAASMRAALPQIRRLLGRAEAAAPA
jgi:NTE family protein